MFRLSKRFTTVLVAFILCLCSPLLVFATGPGGFGAPTSSTMAKAESKAKAQEQKKYDDMNSGADLMIEGSDMMLKKDKKSMSDGQSMMQKGHRMMRSADLKNKGGHKMMEASEMMLKAAEMMMSSTSEADWKLAETRMSEAKYNLIQGKGMMMDNMKF